MEVTREFEIYKTAPKETDGKPRADLIPMDLLIKYLSPAYEYGIFKHHIHSWRKGFKTSDMIGACQRHLAKWAWLGEDFEDEALERANIKMHHIASSIFALLCVLDSIENHPELIDRYIPEKSYNNICIKCLYYDSWILSMKTTCPQFDINEITDGVCKNFETK